MSFLGYYIYCNVILQIVIKWKSRHAQLQASGNEQWQCDNFTSRRKQKDALCNGRMIVTYSMVKDWFSSCSVIVLVRYLKGIWTKDLINMKSRLIMYEEQTIVCCHFFIMFIAKIRGNQLQSEGLHLFLHHKYHQNIFTVKNFTIW